MIFTGLTLPGGPVLRQYDIWPKIIEFSPRELRYSSAFSRSHLPYSVSFFGHVMSGESPWRTLPFRQQLAVMKRQCPRARLREADRLFWVWLSRIWPHWPKAWLVVRPETVVGWHRQGFRLFWTWISGRKPSSRAGVGREVMDLIRRMNGGGRATEGTRGAGSPASLRQQQASHRFARESASPCSRGTLSPNWVHTCGTAISAAILLL